MYVWNYNEIAIFENVTANSEGWIHGYGLKYTTPFTFSAKPLSSGYYVKIKTLSNREYSTYGGTFNMLLEVASLAKREL